MFNSRSPEYRNPTGAISDKESIHFKITLPRTLQCSGAYMLIEKDGGNADCQDLYWCGMNGKDAEWWECHFTPDSTGLYFYHFELKTAHGRKHLFRGFRGEAVPQGSDKWQITVYSSSFQTPDWLTGGILYHIFPDRFYRSEGCLPEKTPAYRRLHENWYDMPDWKPDESGKVNNNDFFCGNLKGIEEKLPYLKSLGVTCVYLNPVFKAYSNHRYDTADYTQTDSFLGGNADFTALCAAAEKLGIRFVIDGAFSHTGSDSIYFNKYNTFDSIGAYNSKESPYYPWYRFIEWPDKYECWWNFDTLPNVDETNPDYDRYINGKDGIVQKWLQNGSSGWRLDVADELPDVFLDHLYAAAKAQNPDALVLGEVWEDATTKTAYGIRRRYLLGGQMDSVMNYPFRDAIIGYLKGMAPENFFEAIETVVENYPPQALHILMNHIGTHDTERILTVLAGEPVANHSRSWQSRQKLNIKQLKTGIKQLKLI